MNIIKKLDRYDFTDFKYRKEHPTAKSFYKVMKRVPFEGENFCDFKKKLSKELGFEEDERGIYYYTMIRYMALALEDMDGKLE